MKNRGFTILEVMLCVGILAGLMVGLIGVYVYCFNLQETSANMSNAIFQVQAKLEEIREAAADNFNNVRSAYDNKETSLTGLNGKMRTEIPQCVYPAGANPSDCNLYDVRIIAGWSQRAGRIIGEGYLFKGAFNFRDLDRDGIIESPVEIKSSLARE